ncbi:unnamed protein product [Brassica rapa]|uniref:Uncharacterized protein n=1 Tax=Brassica campestris TaxID=3711 RepID=A0A3P5Y7F0_BRACM|nr:unnamed protein product [Brassica rapa]VDC63367.1 unnamed protein product [Brassica rapa]
MVSSHIFLFNLNPGCCSLTVVMCLLHFWEAQSVKKKGKLMGVHMLLLNEKIWLLFLP